MSLPGLNQTAGHNYCVFPGTSPSSRGEVSSVSLTDSNHPNIPSSSHTRMCVCMCVFGTFYPGDGETGRKGWHNTFVYNTGKSVYLSLSHWICVSVWMSAETNQAFIPRSRSVCHIQVSVTDRGLHCSDSRAQAILLVLFMRVGDVSL